MSDDEHKCTESKRFRALETDVARHDEQLKTVFKDTERLEDNVESLVQTNQTLSLLCTELKNTVTVLKWVCGTLISVSALFVVVLELALNFRFMG